jgi:peptidyl-prolyl cis-trans isomerase-like protein 2
MGRGKNSNKMYISMKEWTEQFGGKKEGEPKGHGFKPLPFNCCAISLTAFEDPYCTEDGNVYDLVNIVPYIKKYKKDPITGKPLASKDLIALHFHKNNKGEYHCPITFKVFNDFTHIVANKVTGEVYCMEAIEELNIKAKNWNDLLTGAPFTRKDIISIQDPQNLEKRNWANFLHIREKIKNGEIEDPDGGDETSRTINLNSTTERVIKEMAKKEEKEKERKKEEKEKELKKDEKKVPIVKADHAVQAPSFTSSSFTAASLMAAHPADAPPKITKKKGYAKIRTNLGDINVELHCDLTPKTCENFIGLCESGYYNDVIFHRSIKNFMIQGGDPTGTGKGGESIWKRSFKVFITFIYFEN